MAAPLVRPSGGGGSPVTDFPPIPGLAPTAAALTDADSAAYAGPPGSAHAPPRFYKLDFSTFDGAIDPLNWLNQCEQFFRGQRTLASDRTWLVSYQLRGAAQTWYYALERDEGMPTWERFRAVCQMQFGPPTQGTRLAELAHIPFTSTVQEYAERYNAVLCHTDDGLGPAKRPSCSWGACWNTFGWMWRCDTPRISRRQCTTHGCSSVARPHIRR
jgi:hypothetical protein